MDYFNICIVFSVLKITSVVPVETLLCNVQKPNGSGLVSSAGHSGGRHPEGSVHGRAQGTRGLAGVAETGDPKWLGPWEGPCRHSPGLITTLTLRRLSSKGLGRGHLGTPERRARPGQRTCSISHSLGEANECPTATGMRTECDNGQARAAKGLCHQDGPSSALSHFPKCTPK